MIIPVMGITGAGKSTFIKQVSGLDVEVGHSLQSCKSFLCLHLHLRTCILTIARNHVGTSDITIYSYPHESGKSIYLVDTPGFDDTNKSDTDILEDIANFFAHIYKGQYPVAGLIYLHKIDGNRMQGSARKNLRLLQDICGTKALDSVILATTMWDKVALRDGEKNERELVCTEDFWGKMIAVGSKVMRHDSGEASGLRIVNELMERYNNNNRNSSSSNNSSTNSGGRVGGRARAREAPVLQIQKEMVLEKKLLNQTLAGISLDGDLEAQARKHQSEIESLRKEWEQAMSANDEKWRREVEDESRAARAKLRRAERSRRNLAVGLEAIEKKSPSGSGWKMAKRVAKYGAVAAVALATGLFIPL
jgi:hypothetical protein